MENFNDFSLDLTVSKEDTKKVDIQITSKSLCTPGCITGRLMGCNGPSNTCGCTVNQ